LKKFTISLFALAAISTASFASDRNDDLRDSGLLSGGYGTQLIASSTSGNALAVTKDASVLTTFEQLMKITKERDYDHDKSGRNSQPLEK